MAETSTYKVPTNLVKIPAGDTGYNLVKKHYNRFIWTWNQAPENQDDDYKEEDAEPVKMKYIKEAYFLDNEYIDNGGLASSKSIEGIADMHDVSIEGIEDQLDKGTEIESEHTSNASLAAEIALDHLSDDPYYYDKLEKKEVPEEAPEIEEDTGNYGHVYTGEISGMGDSDTLPGATVGYRSGPLSKKMMMPADWYADPDDERKSKRELKNLSHFEDYFNRKI